MTDSTPRAEAAGKSMERPESVLSGSTIQALEGFFSRAAVRGEKGLAIARIVIAILALLRHVFIHGAPKLSWEPRLMVVFLVLIFALVFSVWTLVDLEPGRRLNLRLRFSVSFDAFIVGALVLTRVYWAPEDANGMSHMPETYFLVLVMVASGLRLSRTAASIGVAACWLVFIIAIWIDVTVNITLLAGLRSLAIVIVLMVGASVIGLTTVRRTRRLVLEGASAAQTAERARQTLGVYLSEVVATEALDSADLCAGGSRQDVAVIFCDLRGFTRYSESLPPERLVAELNEYLDSMVRAVREQGGIVDKFIGDAVMVVFGVPRSSKDSAYRAILCAAAMREALRVHNEERAVRGLNPLRNGIGVHFGPAIVGNIGNSDRLQYTVVGDVVNLASRLEGATKELGVPVLVSADVVAAARAHLDEGSEARLPHLVTRGTIHVRGREGEIEVFTLASECPESDHEVASSAATGS